jgi:hypothetical protein
MDITLQLGGTLERKYKAVAHVHLIDLTDKITRLANHYADTK